MSRRAGDTSFLDVSSEETASGDTDGIRQAAQKSVIQQQSEALTGSPLEAQSQQTGEYTTPTGRTQGRAVATGNGANISAPAGSENGALNEGSTQTAGSVQKATYNGGGEALEVTGISSVVNDKVYVQKTNGETAPVDDITFDDPATDMLYEKASKFDTQSAKAFVTSYDGEYAGGRILFRFYVDITARRVPGAEY